MILECLSDELSTGHAWPFVSFAGYNTGRLGCVSDRSASECTVGSIADTHFVVLAAYTGIETIINDSGYAAGGFLLCADRLRKKFRSDSSLHEGRQTVVRNHVGAAGRNGTRLDLLPRIIDNSD